MIALLLALLAQIPIPPPNPPPETLTPQLMPDAGVKLEEPASPATGGARTRGALETPPLKVLEPQLSGGLTAEKLAKIQLALVRAKLDGWLFFDFRNEDAIAYRVLGLGSEGPRTRAWWCLIPARGEPRKLLHAIEPHSLDGVPGHAASYASWRSRDRELGTMLRGLKRVAMDYSPRAEIQTVSRVDAGAIELARSMGPEVVSSAELVAELGSVLSHDELASQGRAAALLAADMEATAQEAARRIRAGQPATERELQEFTRARWRQNGMGEGWPGIAVDAHSANPHYSAPETGSAVVAAGSFLLLDYAARIGPHGAWGDLTRVYFMGDQVPSEIARIASIVFAARDAALQLVKDRAAAGKLPTGAEVDAAARNVIVKAGYGDQFLHRTGHSIDLHGHGDGVNNDDFETHDVRRHLPDTCFSIEPGIYLSGRFGVRSEVDVCLPGGKFELRPDELQKSVPAIH